MNNLHDSVHPHPAKPDKQTLNCQQPPLEASQLFSIVEQKQNDNYIFTNTIVRSRAKNGDLQFSSCSYIIVSNSPCDRYFRIDLCEVLFMVISLPISSCT